MNANKCTTTQLQLLLRDGSTIRSFILEVTRDDTIASIKRKLEAMTGLRSDHMGVVFCGRKLADDIELSSLFLSAQTYCFTLTKCKHFMNYF